MTKDSSLSSVSSLGFDVVDGSSFGAPNFIDNSAAKDFGVASISGASSSPISGASSTFDSDSVGPSPFGLGLNKSSSSSSSENSDTDSDSGWFREAPGAATA